MNDGDEEGGDGTDNDEEDDEYKEGGADEEDDDDEDRDESCDRLRNDKASIRTAALDDALGPPRAIPTAVESESQGAPAKSWRAGDDAAETEKYAEMGDEVAGEREIDNEEHASAGKPNCKADNVECDGAAYGFRNAYFLKWLTLFLRHKLPE